MDDNIGKAVAGLIVAAISALTFVAYKHPKAYAKLGKWLTFMYISAAISLLSWDLSNRTLHSSIMASGLLKENADAISGIFNDLAVPGWYAILPVLIGVYHVFLLSLPQWLLEPEPPKSKNNQE